MAPESVVGYRRDVPLGVGVPPVLSGSRALARHDRLVPAEEHLRPPPPSPRMSGHGGSLRLVIALMRSVPATGRAVDMSGAARSSDRWVPPARNGIASRHFLGRKAAVFNSTPAAVQKLATIAVECTVGNSSHARQRCRGNGSGDDPRLSPRSTPRCAGLSRPARRLKGPSDSPQTGHHSSGAITSPGRSQADNPMIGRIGVRDATINSLLTEEQRDGFIGVYGDGCGTNRYHTEMSGR